MNPFEDGKNNFNVAKHVRDIFDGKKKGESFEVPLRGVTPRLMRATISYTINKKVKTKMVDGKLYAVILS